MFVSSQVFRVRPCADHAHDSGLIRIPADFPRNLRNVSRRPKEPRNKRTLPAWPERDAARRARASRASGLASGIVAVATATNRQIIDSLTRSMRSLGGLQGIHPSSHGSRQLGPGTPEPILGTSYSCPNAFLLYKIDDNAYPSFPNLTSRDTSTKPMG